jgi:hypothetical protein
MAATGQQPSFMAGGSAAAPYYSRAGVMNPRPSRIVRHRTESSQAPAYTHCSRTATTAHKPVCRRTIRRRQGNQTVNRIIWIVGLVVIILFIAGYFGLR